MLEVGNKSATGGSALGRKAFVAMSGGVDSSVSAAILKSKDYDVTGVFIKTWSPEGMLCEWPNERRDAMAVAGILKIPFHTLDLENEYKKSVVDYMTSEYQKGRTPNPDVICNRDIKFGAFYDKAFRMGADIIATGHYARAINGELHQGKDKNKDQSYFLWALKKEQLLKTQFPIGDMEKSDVRALAKKFGLPTADKKDSQGLCFVGKLDFKGFLKKHIPENRGDVVSPDGKVIGYHDGVVFYTIGERRGFIITEKTPSDQPLFVIDKNIEKNQLIVDTIDRGKKKIEIIDENWISGGRPEPNKKYQARIRYRQDLEECTISGNTITFTTSQKAVTSGQSLVLYDSDKCLGGGIIK